MSSSAELLHLDAAVIGTGVVGLAIARALALQGQEVAVFEQADRIGTGTSSRNSEVVHSGALNTTPLKAQLCVEGKALLYDYAAAHGIPHRQLGKLIVATTPAEVATLQVIHHQAEKNGVSDLQWLTAEEAQEVEPAVHCEAALFSPSTGIIDSHHLMTELHREAQQQGALVAFNTPVTSGRVEDDGIVLSTGGREPEDIHFQSVINAAGLQAQALAHLLAGLPETTIPPIYYAKGHYYVLRGASPFHHLVYPVPEKGGLGKHVTLDLAGGTRFGPDVMWVDEVDYGDHTFTAEREAGFYEGVRRYYPDLKDGSLSVGFSGIRPKLGPAGSGEHDFVIQGADTHGVDGLVNLYGIESPGLTASLAIAQAVVRLLSPKS